MVDGMTKLPEDDVLPVIVMAVPSLVNNNAALEVAVNVSSSARAHVLKFFNSRLTVGELLGNCWGTVGELLGNCWGTVGLAMFVCPFV